MSGTHTEAVLNKLTKPELVQLLLKTEATLGSQISDLSKEIKDTLTHLKKLEADLLSLRLLTIDLSRGLSRLKGSAGKTPSIPDVILWKLLSFRVLLTIVSLRKQSVVSLERLVSKLMNGISKPVIA